MVNRCIVIVGSALTGKILAEIKTVGTNGLSKLGKGLEVVLQVELRVICNAAVATLRYCCDRCMMARSLSSTSTKIPLLA